MDISGLAAVVTGGASGLGAATARTLAAAGAKVALFDLNAEAGETLARDIGGVFCKVDVTSEDSVNAGLDAAEAAHGVGRVLVNCAGIGPAGKAVGKEFAPLAMDAYRKVIEINLVGTFLVASRFAARLQQAEPIGEERGVIINTASIAAYEGQIGQVAYSSSKGGVAGLILPMAREFAATRIRVMGIAPGLVLTPMLESLPQAAQDSLGAAVPHPNRLGHPSEYAALVEAIVRIPMLNGEMIRMDGALRMAPR